MSATGMTGTTNPLGACLWCGPETRHIGLCPKVQEIEYHPNGAIKRVVFRDH